MGPLSVDLRKRVVSAIGEGRHELSGGGATVRSQLCERDPLGGGVARTRQLCKPLPMGGDTRSRRVEAHGDYLLRLHRREPDLTLAEICARLERARGEKVSPSMIWRFFDRHDITFKKSRRMRANKTGRTSLNADGDGSTANSTSIR